MDICLFFCIYVCPAHAFVYICMYVCVKDVSYVKYGQYKYQMPIVEYVYLALICAYIYTCICVQMPQYVFIYRYISVNYVYAFVCDCVST